MIVTRAWGDLGATTLSAARVGHPPSEWRRRVWNTDKLGLEVRADATLGSFRWLTVGPKGQPEFELILMSLTPTPMMDEATCDSGNWFSLTRRTR